MPARCGTAEGTGIDIILMVADTESRSILAVSPDLQGLVPAFDAYPGAVI